MRTRRDFLRTSMLTAGALTLSSSARSFGAGEAPRRFVFLHKGNGLFPRVVVPPTLGEKDLERERRKEAFEVDLDGHELPEWMAPLDAHKEHLTILQGLSGKMCTTGHHTWCSSLGVYKANQRLSTIKWATVDFELAKLFPSPMEHIELACFPTGGGNARGNLNGIEKGFSARGPQQPNYAFGSPRVAIRELFQSVSDDERDRVRYELERKMLDFLSRNEGDRAEGLRGLERAKVANYAESIDAIRARNRKVDAMADVIRKYAPELDARYLADDVNTLDRQTGHTEVLLSALISGMTNVAAFTLDELGHPYTGIPGIEKTPVNMHDVGHGKSFGAYSADELREVTRRHQMTQIDTIVRRLKDVPEGSGSMFDNTVLFYFPNSGETHHSKGTEYPFLVLAGRNAKLDLGRRYIRLPYWGREGHKTLGNWYTTILNAYGNPVEHYGDPDVGLKIDQKGPIERFLV